MEKVKNSKKRIIAICLLLASICMIIGTSLAYFSDIVTGNGTITAGTLDISGTVQMYVNGSTNAVTNVENFNPGDVVVIKTNITNAGNKSAHIRTILEQTTSTFTNGIVKVASGEHTATEMQTLSSMTLPYTSESKIINGTGSNAEIETNGIATYEEIFTIYFDPAATNTEQGKTMTLDFKVQAMQYRNNPLPVWSDVVTTPFSL